MKLIKNYEKALQAIYDHVGFEESWVVYPIDDQTDYFWKLDREDEREVNIVKWSDTVEDLGNEETGVYYEDAVYHQRFYDKWIYEGKEFTMILCDSGVDGMRWFRLFDNSKKVG